MAALTNEDPQGAVMDCLVELLSTDAGQAMLAAKEEEFREVSDAYHDTRFEMYRLELQYERLEGPYDVLQAAEAERRQRERRAEHQQKRDEYNARRREERRQATQSPGLQLVTSIAAD